MSPIDEVYFSIQRVADRYTISTRKVYRLTSENVFPKPVRIGGSNKWALSDLIAYEERLHKNGESK